MNKYQGSPATKRRHATALADEFARYYRVLGIDYKSRVDFEKKAWAPRYIKLRHSRKYWYFSIVLGFTSLWVRFEANPTMIEDKLLEMLQKTPTQRILGALQHAGALQKTDTIGFYDHFVRFSRDVNSREALGEIKYETRYESPVYGEFKRNADRLHRSMVETFESLPTNWRRHIYSRFLLQS